MNCHKDVFIYYEMHQTILFRRSMMEGWIMSYMVACQTSLQLCETKIVLRVYKT